jgi:hypothetical protein
MTQQRLQCNLVHSAIALACCGCRCFGCCKQTAFRQVRCVGEPSCVPSNDTNASATITTARNLLNLAVIEPSRGRSLVLYIDLGKLSPGAPAFSQHFGYYIGFNKIPAGAYGRINSHSRQPTIFM